MADRLSVGSMSGLPYISAYRDPELIRSTLECLRREVKGHRASLMEVCGTHTVAIFRHGIRQLLPQEIELVSGPGCPVCVTPNATIDLAVALARQPDVIVATFGDMVRVPGSSSSLERESAAGADVRVVYSPMDAVELAAAEAGRRVVFIGVGFETTAPTVASAILAARERRLGNFFVLCAHKTMPEAMRALVSGDSVSLDGFICPGHVSTIIGAEPYRFLAEEFGKACVIAGFEPLDVVQGLLSLVRQIVRGEPTVEIQYRRVVRPEGNPRALEVMYRVFEPCDSEWRGLGVIPGSGLRIRDAYAEFDAERAFTVDVEPTREHPGCLCGEVLKGLVRPPDCPVYGRVCTPENPIGPCMVSSEGTCAAYYKYSDDAGLDEAPT